MFVCFAASWMALRLYCYPRSVLSSGYAAPAVPATPAMCTHPSVPFLRFTLSSKVLRDKPICWD